MEKQKKLKKFKFYYVDEGYADFLRQNYDSRVPNISSKNYKNKKFFIGVVMNMNGFEYFAPVSSFDEKSDLAFPIKDENNDILASVRCNYMFPVTKDTYKLVPFKDFKTRFYRNFVNFELRYCNRHRSEIYELAENIYQKRTIADYISSKERAMYRMGCCNFERLEQGAVAYQDKQSKLLSDREKTLIDKYPVDAKKIQLLKKLNEKFITAQPDQFAALEQCIRKNIKLAPEVYGKEISERIAKEDLAAKKKAATKVVAKIPVKKTQEKITKKEPQKKKPQNSR